jgi:hypothetical protein
MMDWCDRRGVGYVLGKARNQVLGRLAAPHLSEASRAFEASGEKQVIFADDRYGAETWKRQRRVIIKAEHLHKGANPRFVVTNLDGDGEQIYRQIYCARGDMENRIKEQQLDLFATRTSCQHWWSNQFRLLLAATAYVLLNALRRRVLAGTELARACCGTIRLKLLKIGAVVIWNTRRVRFQFSSSYPYQALFRKVVHGLGALPAG